MEPKKSIAKPLHTYDPEVLSVYLKHHVSGFTGLASLEKFSDGQSNRSFS